MSDTDKAIQQIIENYKSSAQAKDIATFMHPYDASVRVFDTWGVWSYEGKEAWQRAVEGWFTSLGPETVKVTFEDVRISAGREMAIVSAVVTYAGHSAKGEVLRSMQNRLTWGMKTIGHVPRIVHEHTSAPVGFEDAKAILRRDAAS